MEKATSFNLSNGASIKGFVAIREKGSTTQAGFSYFRRKRLIEGSDDEKRTTYRNFLKFKYLSLSKNFWGDSYRWI